MRRKKNLALVHEVFPLGRFHFAQAVSKTTCLQKLKRKLIDINELQKCFSKGDNKRTHFTSFLFLAISSSPILSHLPEKYLTGFHVWGVAWLTVKFLSRSNITPTIRWQRHVRSCLYYIFVVCVVSHQNFGYPSQLSKGKSVRLFHIKKRLFMVKCPFTKILKRSTHKKVSYGQEGGQSQGWNLLKSGCCHFLFHILHF